MLQVSVAAAAGATALAGRASMPTAITMGAVEVADEGGARHSAGAAQGVVSSDAVSSLPAAKEKRLALEGAQVSSRRSPGEGGRGRVSESAPCSSG